MMKILQLNNLTIPETIEPQLNKVTEHLECNNFHAAQVKKMPGTGLYRAKLNRENRLLFKIVQYCGEKCLLLLEIILNHDYSGSRFLRGAEINPDNAEPINSSEEIEDTEVVTFINPRSTTFHLLDKPISFDDDQNTVYQQPLPLIFTGPAGSGKTIVLLEKMKTLPGRILYVTRSKPLADNTRRLYQQNGFDNPDQEVVFLSYTEFQAGINPPTGKELSFEDFARWFRPNMASCPVKNIQAMYEEFFGVITGAGINAEYLSEEDYIELGVRQSLIEKDDRRTVYTLFLNFLEYMREKGFYHPNMHGFNSLDQCREQYDYVVVDEVQDITNIQLALLLKSLKTPGNFMLSGDSHQIVHPSSFSWSNIKTMLQEFHANSPLREININILPNNYRNSQTVTEVANKLMKIKNIRFGSIDRESCYLSIGKSEIPGSVELLPGDKQIIDEFNDKTARSIEFAVVVLHDGMKALARKLFKTPLVFSVRDIKGLEYENVILFDMVSCEGKAFDDIARGVTFDSLNADLRYNRAPERSDKSLEILKFFINSLITGVTRGINNLYMIESRQSHPLLNLMGLSVAEAPVKIEAKTSTEKEWKAQEETLRHHDNIEQAKAIKDMMIFPRTPATGPNAIVMPNIEGGINDKDAASQDVPWEILTRESMPVLLKHGLDSDQYNKQSKKQLHELSLAYNLHGIKYILKRLSYNLAGKEDEAQKIFKRNYQQMYQPDQTHQLMKEIKQYGVNFRNKLNQTPLMIACQTGNERLAAELLEMGADPFLTDNTGRMPFHHLWQYGANTENININNFGEIYPQLEPKSMTLKIRDSIFTLNKQNMAFFILNYMLAVISERVAYGGILKRKYYQEAPSKRLSNTRGGDFSAGGILWAVQDLPDSVMPKKWKRKKYISRTITINSTHSNNPSGQGLFVRVSKSYYIINPLLEVHYGKSWINFYDLVYFSYLQCSHIDYSDLHPLQIMVHYLRSKNSDLADIDYRYFDDGAFNWVHLDPETIASEREKWARNPAWESVEQYYSN